MALETLLRAARPHVRRHAERHCITEADDATQEALLVLHRKIGSLRSVAALAGWLARIVARICAGMVAPLWRRIEELKEADMIAAVASVPAELRFDLARAVDELPPIYRDALLLHYYRDLSVAEVAACLDITPVAAKVRLHRGRERLRRCLTER